MSDEERERFRLRHCGFIFQGSNLMPALNARDHLEMVLSWGTRTAVGRSETQDRGHARPAWSVPQGRSCCRNIFPAEKNSAWPSAERSSSEPDLFFADEPTSALDWEHGKHIVELLRDTAHGGADRGDGHARFRILPYADRVYRLEDGRRLRTPRELGAPGCSS